MSIARQAEANSIASFQDCDFWKQIERKAAGKIPSEMMQSIEGLFDEAFKLGAADGAGEASTLYLRAVIDALKSGTR